MPNESIVKNAVRCGICGAPADRHVNWFQCQEHPEHAADLYTGIFSDLTYPDHIRQTEES